MKNDVQKESEDKSEISTPNKDWVNGFKKPANLYDITIGGDAVSSDIQAAQEFPELLKAVLQHRCCPPGLCHHVPSYPAAAEFKAKKYCLTLLLAGSAKGEFKPKPMLVCHAETPQAMKKNLKVTIPVMWKSNYKAWVTIDRYFEEKNMGP
ncbi:Tigger transposable element-derived protein 1 [Trichinella pseudospiralis]|uniref:Tigger transposable element-derived protein 1 n=1 Tax=Trichinella pseudospiralis TaxID=6337 RepID=A0A0V1FY44_TRIPS|nr:Tigger transposable element-derived protein 1 [Trichinella pseudospiralis]